MPIYEYRCSACGHQDEFLQKVSDPAIAECPACGKPALQKLLSAAGFQLKGSGWYATDFKGSKPAEKKGEAKTEAKGETKTEAKPEAKPKSAAAAD
ncbi:MAG TPA: zinc ribbon domain-containing protein [Burkholderiales bacterium]|nr:zinc ribbon domain-containing protein [Burkholderiales bacterium]